MVELFLTAYGHKTYTMKTAEDFLHTKGIPSDTIIGVEGDILLTELLQSYASQPSPVMSAEQVDGCCSLELCSSKKRLSVQCIKPNDCQFHAASLSVKSDEWEKFDVRKVIPFELKNGRYVDSNGNEITTSMLMKNRHDMYFDNGLLYID